MCGGSTIELDGYKVDIYLGYHGAVLTIDDASYKEGQDKEPILTKIRSMTNNQIAEMLFKIIDNGSEE